MKHYIHLLWILLLFTGCFNDPLFNVRRLARSRDIEKKQEASREYKKAIETLVQAYSSYAGVNKDVGRRLMLENQFKPALKHLRAAVEIRNNDSELYYWIGVCYANLANIEKNDSYLFDADYYYEIALNLTPRNKAYIYSYAQLHIFKTEEFRKAENVLYNYLYKKEEIQSTENKGTKDFKIGDVDFYMLLGRTYYMIAFNSDRKSIKKEHYAKAYKVYQELYQHKKHLSKKQIQQLDTFIMQTGENLQ